EARGNRGLFSSGCASETGLCVRGSNPPGVPGTRGPTMTRNTANPSAQPTLDDLMVRFLASRSDAATVAVEPGGGGADPHGVAAGFRVDPRAAWTAATALISTGGQTPGSPAVHLPNDWSSLVSQPAPAFAVPMGAGNFPQRVRDLHPLLAKF